MIASIVVEPAWADEARIGEVRVLADDRLDPRQHRTHVGRHVLAIGRGKALVEVHVRPGPQLVGRRQRGPVGDVDARRGTADALVLVEFGFLKHDEREPRAELEARAVGRRGRITPEKILVVELDRGEIVRLVVSDPRTRVGAEDGAHIDAHDVAWPVEGNVLR